MSTLTYPHPHDFMSGGHRIGQLVASFDAPSSLGGVMANAGQPIPQAFSDPQHQITYLAGSMGRETLAQIVDKVAAQYGLNQTERKHLETDLRQQVGNFSQALDHIVFTPSQPKYLSITLPSGSVYNPAAQYFQNTATPSVPIISDGNGVQVRARYVSAGTSLGALWQEAQQLDPRLTRDTFIALNAERFGLFPAVASAIDMRNLPNETPVDTAGLVFLTTPQVDLPGIEAIAQRPNNREKIATFLKEVLVLMGEKMPEEAYDAFVSGELTLSAVVGAGLSHYLGGSAAAATAAGKVALGIGSFLTGALMGILKNATEFDTLPEVRTYARQLTNDGRIPARAFAHLLAGGIGALGYRPVVAGLMAQETTVVGAGTAANVIDITPGAARALAPNTSGQISPHAINAPSLISGQTTGAMGGAVAMSPARPSGTSQNFTTRFESYVSPNHPNLPAGYVSPMTAETAAETLAGMMYIPDGARVTVYEQITRHNSRPMMSYQVSVNHPYFDEHGYVVDFVYPLQFGGMPSCETIIIDQLYVDIGASGQGHGLQTLVDLVRFGVRDGAKSIRMKAEGYYDPPGMNPRAIYQDAGGATVWPRMGFDTYLHPFEEAIPAQFQHRGTLQSLLSTADGRAWWAENNFTLPLVFDLRGGSQSRQILRTYATERGYEAHGL